MNFDVVIRQLIRIQSQILVVSKCMLSVPRPSSEVVREGRISQNQTLARPTVGVFLVDDSWAHSKSRSYNLKNCNFLFGASLVPRFGEMG
ncbi:MAG: hypothetical protein JXB49_24030 [Bacteroidales bacterium]|nr:hypothetical protein [Bacteroidales bacterium]